MANPHVANENVVIYRLVEMNAVEENEDNGAGQTDVDISVQNDLNEMKDKIINKECRDRELENESSYQGIEVNATLEKESDEFHQRVEEYIRNVPKENDRDNTKNNTDVREHRDREHEKESSNRLIEENAGAEREEKELIPQNITQMNTNGNLT